ncbi:MAG TPA: acyltransferase [Candidatus Corynebacterium avicola]|uniref:Acyltransferase n=1 Tax=Candidatus Corynebacterium avicola TaxID=2838527 RepID=A0A9D1UJV7_9CORY|nr:acyltransferase [Candidatus Corynebacterium avicola]
MLRNEVLPAPVPAPARGNRRVTLDWLRGLAVALVVGYHVFPQVLPGGLIGVDLFFVLSGFLVTTVLLTGRSKGPHLWSNWTAFWIRRTRRLVPAMLAALVGGTLTALVLLPDVPAKLGQQWLGALTWSSNWLYASDETSYFAKYDQPWWLHLWSVGIEAQFYLVWPVILTALLVVAANLRRTSATVMAVGAPFALAVLSAGAFVLASTAGADPSSLYMNSAMHAFGLLAGAGVAVVAHRRQERREQLRRRQPRVCDRTLPSGGGITRTVVLPALPAVVAVLGVLAIIVLAAVSPTDDPRFLGPTIIAASAIGALVVAMLTLLPEPSSTHKLGWLEWLGNRSYAIYLWHWPILLALRGIAEKLDLSIGAVAGAPQSTAVVTDPFAVLLVGVVTIALSLVIAELSWRYVEQPVLRDGWRGAVRSMGAWLKSTTQRPAALFDVVLVAVLVLAGVTAALVLSPGMTDLETQLSSSLSSSA